MVIQLLYHSTVSFTGIMEVKGSLPQNIQLSIYTYTVLVMHTCTSYLKSIYIRKLIILQSIEIKIIKRSDILVQVRWPPFFLLPLTVKLQTFPYACLKTNQTARRTTLYLKIQPRIFKLLDRLYPVSEAHK